MKKPGHSVGFFTPSPTISAANTQPRSPRSRP
nr:MAG TPA: hypothetical protein [Caudoviricetes sp.]